MALTEKYVSSLAAGGGTGLTAGSPLTWAEMIAAINAGGQAGSRFNVAADGTYSRTTTTDTISGAGTSTSPVVIRGYKTAIGDGYLGRPTFGGSGPLSTANMPAVAYTSGLLNVTGAWIILESLNVSGSALSGAGVVALGPDGVLTRCAVTNSSTAGVGNAAYCAVFNGSRGVLADNDLTIPSASAGSVSVGINTGNQSPRIVANRIIAAVGTGIVVSSAAPVIADNIIAAAGVGVSSTAAATSLTLIGNTIFGGTSAINLSSATQLQAVFGNLLTDGSAFGINAGSAVAVFAAFNRFDRNSSGPTTGAADWLTATGYGRNIASVTQAQEYQAAASGDYRLLPTSPAVGAGFFPFRDIGALQRQAGGLLVPADDWGT